MHANLVSPSGLQFDVEQREPFEASTNSINRKRWPAATDDRHSRAVTRIARDRLIDFAGFLFHLSANERDVRLEHSARAKLIREMLVGCFCLGHHQQTGRTFIQTMHDPRTRGAPGARQLLKMKSERV